MGRWVQSYDRTGVKGIFWRFYFFGVFLLFFVFFAAASVKYYDENKNNAKIVGSILGTIISLIPYGILGTILGGNWIATIIIGGIGIPLSIIFTMLVYAKLIGKWVDEEKKTNAIKILSELKIAKEKNLITDENYERYKAIIEQTIVKK